MQKYAIWFKVVAILAAITLLSGCISEKNEKKPETGYVTEVSLDHKIIFQNITAPDHYIVRLNTTAPVKTNVSENALFIYPTINNPKQENSLSMILTDVGKGNETYNNLENVTRRLIRTSSWKDAKISSTSVSWYATLNRAEINGHQGILETGYRKYEPTEVIAVYSPLPGTLMIVQSTLSKQETWNILNTTTVKEI